MIQRLRVAVSLDTQVLLSCVAVFCMVLGTALHGAVASGLDASRHTQHELLATEVSALTELLAESAPINDYGTIQALLTARVQHPGIERLEWTDGRGIHLSRSATPVAVEAPAWFARLVDLRVFESRSAIVAAGVGHGELTVSASATHRINAIWRTAFSEARYAAISMLAVLVVSLIVAHQALQPLRHLVEAVSRFSAGEFSTRAVARGPREIAAIIKAFNRMAGQIESNLGALRASEQKNRQLAMIVEQTSEAILTRGIDGRITFWNRGAERLFGYTASEAIGRTARELQMRNLSDEQFEAIRARVQSAQTVTTEGERITKAGDIIYVESTATPLVDERGDVVGAVGVARDITERRRMHGALRSARDELEQRVLERTEQLAAATEAAQQASRAKGEFLANMSHEVRTPMNGVLGMLGLLLKTELSTRQRHFAKTAHSSGLALLKVLNDILDFSKIEAGKLELETINFSIRERISDMVQLLAQRAYDKGLELECRVDHDVPDAVRGDPDRIRQVLSNLISNAVKFTDAGEVVIRVSAVRCDAREIELRISVQDSGIGIDAQGQARLFQPFSQADASMTRRFGGTGLGLAVSRSLVGLLGGEMGVNSTPGQGSTFWFTALLERGEVSDARLSAASLVGLRVIAASASPIGREILTGQLHDCGVTADVVESGAQALALMEAAAERAPYDVAVLALDDAAGLRCTRAIRDRPSLASIRLILISSLAADIPTAQLRELRIERVLSKPVSERQLQRALLELDRPVGHAAADPVPRHFNAYVLIVDDYAVNQEIMCDLLEELGCRTDAATDGAAAVNATARNRYDLVFMDCQMPVMDGYQATAAIRQREAAGGPRLPIVALTAHAMKGDRDLCLAAGMDDYVSKPFEPEHVHAVLERWLKRSVPKGQPPLEIEGAEGERPAAIDTVIDPAAIARLRAMQRPGKPDPAPKWISSFLASTPQHLQAMHDAAAADDAQTLQRYAHTLKSGAAQFGAIEFSRRCAALEALSQGGDIPKARELLIQLQVEYEPVRSALQLHLRTDDSCATTSATADGGARAS